ncbi:MFS transporter [Kineosporia sp. A_224]|uniref:MFS transporter n=1 Tax=Kineosporia sp. A_224 TaxID=1962180 RepID=UPI000B4B6ABD
MIRTAAPAAPPRGDPQAVSTQPSAPELVPADERRREQRAWYFYDWANSAYVTTTATVLFGPYLTVVAKKAACPDLPSDARCGTDLSVLGIPVSPGSLALYTVTFATLVSALVLPVVGAVVDRSGHKRTIMARFAWGGALAAGLMFLVAGDNWQLGVLLQLVASLCLGCSLVVYDAILCEIATPDERDGVSSRGWALGYLGGGLLLAVNLGLLTFAESIGLSTSTAVRISLLSAGIWWAAFTFIPYRGLRDRPPASLEPVGEGNLVGQSFKQLGATLRHLRGYPNTLMFLVAYLFFNDGIQTVITASSIFGQEELGFDSSQLVITILLVQFVGFFGALGFGKVAARVGSWRTILASLVLWCAVVGIGYFLPERRFGLFLALAVLIGLVLGGSQALSRSLYSMLVPRGREAEYFSLYQAAERGTSWFGTLLFGIVQQVTDSYRLAIVALVVFFVVGGLLLARVDVRQGITDAGNTVPAVV